MMGTVLVTVAAAPTGYLDVIQVVRWWHLGHRLQQGRHVSWAKLLKQRAEPRISWYHQMAIMAICEWGKDGENVAINHEIHGNSGYPWISDMESDYGILPVVPHKAVAEVSKIGNL
jgi:hypothetical protein